MKLVFITSLILTLSGCITTLNDYVEGALSVKLGDSYDEIVAKVGDVPRDYKCNESKQNTYCSAYYLDGSYIFRFENSNVITSMTR